MTTTPLPSEPPGYGRKPLTPTPGPTIDRKPRCWRCDSVVIWYAARPWKVACRKCRAVNRSPGGSVALGPHGYVAGEPPPEPPLTGS